MKKIFIIITLIFALTLQAFSMEIDSRNYPNLAKIRIYGEQFFSLWNAININGEHRMKAILNLEVLAKEKVGIEKYDLYSKFNKLDQEQVIYKVAETVDSNHKNYDSYIKGTEELEKFIGQCQSTSLYDLLQNALQCAIDIKIERHYKIIGQANLTQMRYKKFKLCWLEAKSIQDKSLVFSYLISDIIPNINSLGQIEITKKNNRDYERFLSENQFKQDQSLIFSYLISDISKELKFEEVKDLEEYQRKGIIEHLMYTIEHLKDELNLFIIAESILLSDWIKLRTLSLIDDIDVLIKNLNSKKINLEN